MRDLYNTLAASVLIPAGTYAADNTPIVVDLAGFEAAVILIEIGAGGITFSSSNKVEFVLSHSDDNATFTPVTDSDLIGAGGVTNGIVKALTSAHATADVTRIGYKGGKRYLRLLADFSGTHGTGTPISAVVVKGGSRFNPPV